MLGKKILYATIIFGMLFHNMVAGNLVYRFQKKYLTKNMKTFSVQPYRASRLMTFRLNKTGAKNDSIPPRSTAGKIYAVGFMTLAGCVVGLTYCFFKFRKQESSDVSGVGFFACPLYGAVAGFASGIIIVSFDLDKPFRKKHRRKK
jgi:hypothetical protein